MSIEHQNVQVRYITVSQQVNSLYNLYINLKNKTFKHRITQFILIQMFFVITQILKCPTSWENLLKKNQL